MSAQETISVKRRLERLAVVIAAIFVLYLAFVGFLSITRGTPVQMVIAEGDRGGAPRVTDSLFERTIELYTGTHMDSGNMVQSVNNGSVYDSLWHDLHRAQRTITVQMYYSLPGKVADSLAAILAERARAHVRVLLLLDAFGSQHLSARWAERLRQAGVELALLRKLKWYSIHNATDRSHVRVVVIDGRIAYTGGFGLADYWLGDGRHEEQWRESNVRFVGPAAMQLQAAFAAGWAEATGELITGDVFFPRSSFAPIPGGIDAGVLYTAPTTGSTPAERFLALSIASARKSLYITNSYFVPDDDFRSLLLAAVKRGVDVRVLTVSSKTDVKTTWYAGRYWYEELLRGGVRIFEYQPTMMHSKTIVVDGEWATIGSMNFDNRSLAFNNESNLVVLDPGFGAQMDSVFEQDLRYSREIRLAEFRKRPWWDHVLETGAVMLSRVL
ncbi:MAG TPA: phospholipase D-like domain-containing protein [Gemmatimonadaceae bacterium]|nr:phospholipase D-like domain-containing protein [Gemmatimonadaceae bacterium]